jgi:hypothetical protein
MINNGLMYNLSKNLRAQPVKVFFGYRSAGDALNCQGMNLASVLLYGNN